MKRATPAVTSVKGLPAGTLLGKYQLLKPLARGGMAELYLARPQSLPGFEKLLAIKRMLPELAADRDLVQMFLDEARLAATLEHPNVVQTYDVGVVDGSYFLAMEFLHGEDVATILRALERAKARMPLDVALAIGIAVCAGLHYAHEKHGTDGEPLGIVHRDVSPQNVIVTYEGGVKLLDFGVAKAATQSTETRVGTIKGKLSYLSPEQCRCEEVDRRSDLWSLGIVLYELTLGKRPFAGKTELEVIEEILEKPVTPPRSLDPDYPEALERLVMSSLDRSRAGRPNTAREVGEALEQVARELGLFPSTARLASFMEDEFRERAAKLREAQRVGWTMVDPVIALSTVDLVDVEAGRPETIVASESMIVEDVTARGKPGTPARTPSRPSAKARRAEPVDDPSPWSTAAGSLVAAVLVCLILWLVGRP